MLRSYSITRTRAPADTRDASHPAPIWRARRGARRSDGGLLVSKTARPPMEGRARLDRAPCARVSGCNDPPMTSGSIAGATPIPVSTSPGTRVESFRSPVRRSHWPSGGTGQVPGGEKGSPPRRIAARFPVSLRPGSSGRNSACSRSRSSSTASIRKRLVSSKVSRGMQYGQRKSQQSTTGMRRSRNGRLSLSISMPGAREGTTGWSLWLTRHRRRKQKCLFARSIADARRISPGLGRSTPNSSKRRPTASQLCRQRAGPVARSPRS